MQYFDPVLAEKDRGWGNYDIAAAVILQQAGLTESNDETAAADAKDETASDV